MREHLSRVKVVSTGSHSAPDPSKIMTDQPILQDPTLSDSHPYGVVATQPPSPFPTLLSSPPSGSPPGGVETHWHHRIELIMIIDGSTRLQ